MDRLFPHFRKRRSARLNLLKIDNDGDIPTYVSKRSKTEPATSGSGCFTHLPMELKHTLFSYLSVLDLSLFSLASKEMARLIEEYRLTQHGGIRFMLYQDCHHVITTDLWPSSLIQDYYRLGIYMKRATCLLSTTKRLRLMGRYLEMMLCENDTCDQAKCVSMFCYGTFLHTVVAGWDDLECVRVLQYVSQTALVPRSLNKILSAAPGDYTRSEIFIRCFYRRVFLDVLRKREDKAFWLSQILKHLPMVCQARVLQLLFLPKSKGIDYNILIEDRVDMRSLSELGASLLMLAESRCWNDDNIISVFDEIIAIPSIWHQDNVASLLLCCGEIITVKVLASLRGHGKITPASRCVWSVVRHLKAADKHVFVNLLLDTFKNSIIEINEYGVDMYNELDSVVEGLTQFSKELIDKTLEIMETEPAFGHNVTFTKLVTNHDSSNASQVEE